MRSPILDYRDSVLEQTGNFHAGAVADYTPGLAAADPNRNVQWWSPERLEQGIDA